MTLRTFLFLWLTLFSTSFATASGVAAISSCEAFLRGDERQSLRDQFVFEYASKVYASEQENLEWILSVKNPVSPPRFYVVVKNSALKALNDTIVRDKDLVTALTNFHKELFLKEITSHFPKGSYQLYSDFKSVRLEISEEPTEGKLLLIDSLFQRANQKFYNDPTLQQILRSEDLRQRGWFTLGTGRAEGEAGLAARGARTQSTLSARFESSSFQEKTLQRLAQFQNLHQKLVDALESTKMVEMSSQNQFRFSLDVFLHCRKADSPAHLFELLKDEFQQISLLTSALAEQLFNYCAIADEFSPSLLIAKREILTIEKAPFGVIGLDFIGLGAENLRSTADALVNSANLEEVLRKSREGEMKVTEAFLKRKVKIKEITERFFSGAVSIRFSGDDGIIIPERRFSVEDQLSLLDQLSQILPYPFFRMSTIHTSHQQPAVSIQMISQAESIEKILRPSLRKRLGAEVSKKIHVNIFNTEQSGTNKVFLVLKTNTELGPEQTEILYDVFRQAVQTVEKSLRSRGEDLNIEPGTIFSAAG